MKKTKANLAELGISGTIGAVGGTIVRAAVGRAGLAVAGTGVSVGLGTFVVAGILLGCASYGIYRAVTD